jgi:leucyl-tRNA synthetase
MVNYDPVDKTVLANEQVDANGFSWRSGAKVEKRLLKQWFLKISDYRQDLLDGLKELSSEWPERVLSMQKNWLGKSTGAKIKFAVKGTAHSAIEVFTTRPDTLFGAQYLALASIHPLVQELAAIDKDLEAFVKAVPTFPPDSKIGYLLPNIEAINPLASEESTPDFAKEALPIYVAPYVLGDYGDGAVMGVPGHDTRDHSFWKYNKGDKPIKTVVTSVGKSEKNDASPFIHAGQLTSECGPYSGLTSVNATTQIVQFLESKDLGSAAETWRLRDWLISRQRYWGTPIPIIHCETCGPVPVPVEQLPVELPPLKSGSMNEKTGNALDHAHDWVKTLCPKCHGPAKRDTDTMDTFVDSSWYFMRFIDPHNKAQLFSPEIAARLLPVDVYIGGVEHAILHLLYARFISKFLSRSFNSKIRGEPFKQVLTQGMVHGKTYSDPKTGRFLKPAEMKLTSSSKPVIKATGKTPNVSFEKMSKSKYNGVDPGMCMDQYGADTTRAHILFQAPVTEVLEWDDGRIAGVTRWLRRIHDHIESRISWWTQDEHLTSQSIHFDPKEFLLTDLASRPNYALDHSLIKKVWEDEKVLWRAVQSTIMSVTTSYGKTYSLNTVVSDLMALTNAIINFSDTQIPNEGRRSPALHYAATKMLVQMMAPITPAFSEECWTLLHTVESFKSQGLYHSPPNNDTLTRNSVFDSRFPIEDGTLSLLAPETQKCAVQVNGKLKFAVELSLTELARKHGKELEKWIVGEILGTEEGTKWKDRLDGTDVKKVIVVRGGKTVNFVLSEKGASKM